MSAQISGAGDEVEVEEEMACFDVGKRPFVAGRVVELWLCSARRATGAHGDQATRDPRRVVHDQAKRRALFAVVVVVGGAGGGAGRATIPAAGTTVQAHVILMCTDAVLHFIPSGARAGIGVGTDLWRW